MVRGAEQRSIVLVSEVPYSAILAPVVRILGPALLRSFSDTAAGIALDACHAWPLPTPGALCNICIGPHRVIGRVPLDACLPASEVERWPPQIAVVPSVASLPLCGAFSDVCLARTLHALSRHLWHLWELMLVGAPVMVFCSCPESACRAVGALLALITPLPYEPDYRPLLSIHDPQVSDVQACRPPSGLCCCRACVNEHSERFWCTSGEPRLRVAAACHESRECMAAWISARSLGAAQP